jgi:AcrR family transcriptional regulator
MREHEGEGIHRRAARSGTGERERRIFAAALREFARKGYAAASTNEIARAAGVSKGLAFHIHGNKKGLYLSVLDRSLEHLMRRLAELVGPASGGDIFDRLLAYGVAKLRLAVEEPDMSRLMVSAFTDIPAGLEEEMARRYGGRGCRHGGHRAGFDPAKLREGVDQAAALSLLSLFLEGWAQRHMESMRKSGAGLEEVMAMVGRPTKGGRSLLRPPQEGHLPIGVRASAPAGP